MLTLELITILPLNTPHNHVSHFVLTSFSDALVTFVNDQVYVTSITTNGKHRVRTTGSEHQGQNSISDPDQNLGFNCIFLSGMQEKVCKDQELKQSEPNSSPQNQNGK